MAQMITLTSEDENMAGLFEIYQLRTKTTGKDQHSTCPLDFYFASDQVNILYFSIINFHFQLV